MLPQSGSCTAPEKKNPAESGRVSGNNIKMRKSVLRCPVTAGDWTTTSLSVRIFQNCSRQKCVFAVEASASKQEEGVSACFLPERPASWQPCDLPWLQWAVYRAHSCQGLNHYCVPGFIEIESVRRIDTKQNVLTHV